MAFTNYAATLTTGTVNVKGAYTQIVASTPYASSRLHLLCADWPSGPGLYFLLDLAKGASGSETIIVSNFFIASDHEWEIGEYALITVDLPAGTRLSIRGQSANLGASAFTIHVLLEDRALASISNPVSYGANSGGVTQGTQVDPGAVVNTKGSYSQLTASTTARIDRLLICCAAGSVVGLTTSTKWSVDVATGASGSEVIVIPDLSFMMGGGGWTSRPRPGLVAIPIAIPAGTRLAIRCASDNTTAAQRVLGFVLIGMQEPATGSSGGTPTSAAYLG